MMESRIYCVLNPNGRAPHFVHETYELAKEEAKRLAKNNPDQKFYVMESVGLAIKREVAFYVHEQHVSHERSIMVSEDEIPF